MVLTSHRVTGGAVVFLLLSGCALGGQSCTDMGAYSGVNFDFKSVLAKVPARGAKVETCVSSRCTTRTLQNRNDFQVFLRDDTLDDDTSLSVAATVTTRTGEVVFDGETEVTPARSQPNGPGCDPTVYGAQV